MVVTVLLHANSKQSKWKSGYRELWKNFSYHLMSSNSFHLIFLPFAHLSPIDKGVDKAILNNPFLSQTVLKKKKTLLPAVVLTRKLLEKA